MTQGKTHTQIQIKKLSLRGNRSNLAFFNEIATHLILPLAGLAMTEWDKGFGS